MPDVFGIVVLIKYAGIYHWYS